MLPVDTSNGARPLFGPRRKGSVAVGQYGGAGCEIGKDEDVYEGTARYLELPSLRTPSYIPPFLVCGVIYLRL
ncbi:hypothetical protein P691DRAFT_769734 [Macrolepiota fuliginosa MF-IS2]|uniref:Uncharacterized protein n=1 Tax=Macrolepiota fuliginosa MF-IS2 TaxID=1400762 RepID=A0A9P6BVJ7_9AGAR|nr:hypothetical protein P691DRAFT_769734 [Macrolepiota fuliginosa MF-IS2]